MEEINLKELFKFFMHKIKYMLFIVIVFGVLGIIYIKFIQTPMYHSSTTLILVSNASSNNSTVMQNDVTLNKNLVTTYSQIVKSRTVLAKVIDKLNLSMTPDQLSGQINVTAVENTEIIKIEVSDKNNKRAQKIATATSEVFMEEIQDIYKLTNISTVDKASLEKYPYNVNVIKQLGMFLIGGVLLSIVVFLMIFYFDTTIKSGNDIEEKLGLPVLGNVTIANKNKGGK